MSTPTDTLDDIIEYWSDKIPEAKLMKQQRIWDVRFLRIAREISSWSKDPSTQIGAVAVRDRRILASGYNGFPRGIEDLSERLNDRETKHKYVVHAEQNLIYNATEHGVSLKGASVYVWGLPNCSECTKGLIQVGVKEIICATPVATSVRWMDSYKLSQELMKEAGVTALVYNTEEI